MCSSCHEQPAVRSKGLCLKCDWAALKLQRKRLRNELNLPLFPERGKAPKPRFYCKVDPDELWNRIRGGLNYTDFELTLRNGYVTPGSIWECHGERYVVRGNEWIWALAATETGEFPDEGSELWEPQRLEKA